jgi:hypothetical protein
LKEEKTLSQIASEYETHTKVISRRRDQALAALPGVFSEQLAQELATKEAAREKECPVPPSQREMSLEYRSSVTLLASLSLLGIGETMMLERAANTQVFEFYLEQVLAPSLQKGQVVIMDSSRRCSSRWKR